MMRCPVVSPEDQYIAQVDPELSAQDHALDPPLTLYDSIISATVPYVPAIIKNVPDRTTHTLQRTINRHFSVGCCLPALQLSYSHMQPIGWNDIRVPSSAPIKDTRPLKTGMALAMMYATTATPQVLLSQTTQCTTVLAVRCLELRKTRTKTCLLGSYDRISLPAAGNSGAG